MRSYAAGACDFLFGVKYEMYVLQTSLLSPVRIARFPGIQESQTSAYRHPGSNCGQGMTLIERRYAPGIFIFFPFSKHRKPERFVLYLFLAET